MKMGMVPVHYHSLPLLDLDVVKADVQNDRIQCYALKREKIPTLHDESCDISRIHH